MSITTFPPPPAAAALVPDVLGVRVYPDRQSAANTLVGNPTGAPAAVQDVTLPATLSFSGTALQTGAGTGDVTWSANSFATTLATVNSNVGSFGAASKTLTATADGKGRLTALAEVSIAVTSGQVSGLAAIATSGSASDLTTGTVPNARLDAELAAVAGLTSAADKLPYFTGSGTAALADFTSFARTLVDDANAAAAQATLGLVIGTNVQAWDADLDALAALAATAGMVSRTGAGAFAVRTITGTSARVSVTNGTGASGNPTIDIDTGYVGQASITTLGTITAGTWTGTTIAVANGGTGQTTAQAAIDALMAASGALAQGDVFYYDGTHVVKLARPSVASVLYHPGGAANPAWKVISISGTPTFSGTFVCEDGTTSGTVSGLTIAFT